MEDRNTTPEAAKRGGSAEPDGAAPAERDLAALGTDERRQHMLGFIRAKDFVRIQDLARAFAVSEVTVRSDLDILARDGSVRRVHGGVVAVLTARKETAFEERAGSFAQEKRLIARAAVDLISNGDSIILDAGTTTMAIAHALADRSDLAGLTVFTPGLNVALALERAIPRIQVVVTGGSCSRAALACERHRAIALAPSTMTIRALAASAMGCLATRVPPFFGS